MKFTLLCAIRIKQERRWRDLNPRAAINDLHPFQGCPFSQLGYISNKLPESCIPMNHIGSNFYKRRGWDSNPRALADKRFSRPPRYDHFDTSPFVLRCFFLPAHLVSYHVFSFLSITKLKNFHLHEIKKFPSTWLENFYFAYSGCSAKIS